MSLKLLTLRTLAIGCLLAAATFASAQSANAGGRSRGSFSSLINIDALIENHCRMLARRYNLTPEQDEFTQDFLHAKADEFLEIHRDEMFKLADELFAVRAGADMEPEELVAWGKRVLPLYQSAKLLIVDGNEDWRSILTEEQKRIHDEDLRQMYQSFQETESQLDRIVTGRMAIEEFRRGPTPQRTPPRPPIPEKPSDLAPAPQPRNAPRAAARTGEDNRSSVPERRGAERVTPRPATPTVRHPVRPAGRPEPKGAEYKPTEDFEGEWEKYVREFIERYQLNDSQAQRAKLVLKSCQDQANNYMQKRRTQIEQLDEQIEEMGKSKERARDAQKLRERKEKLLAPIGQIFEKRLKPRLERLPTSAQRAAAKSTNTDKSSARPDRSSPGGQVDESDLSPEIRERLERLRELRDKARRARQGGDDGAENEEDGVDDGAEEPDEG